MRRTVRKSSIRAIAAMTSPNLVTKESESSASDDPSPRLAITRRRSSGDSSTQKAPLSPEAKQRQDGRVSREQFVHCSPQLRKTLSIDHMRKRTKFVPLGVTRKVQGIIGKQG